MREILFRGKRIDNGEWVEGCLILSPVMKIPSIAFPLYEELSTALLMADVAPSTVGQYTGLRDKNGKKVFEGDIVKETFEWHNKARYAGYGDEWSDEEDGYGWHIGVVAILARKGVVLKKRLLHLELNGEEVTDTKPKSTHGLTASRCEVIGNIHDNPELVTT